MAKMPVVGEAKTRLSPPLTLAQAAALYEAMLRDTISLVAGLRGMQMAIAVTPPDALEFFRANSPPDTLLLPADGAGIGECLSLALGHLFEAGFRKVLAVNSDGPSLPFSYLERAVILLEHVDVVLGPSEDGGYYLIGMKSFHPELLRDIEWSTPRVTAQTIRRAEGVGLTVEMLEPWYDVDAADDVARLREELAALPDGALPHTRSFFATFSMPFSG